MADYQVLGSYIVSETLRETPIGVMSRGIVAPDGKFEKFVLINHLNRDLRGFPEFFKSLNSNFKTVSKLTGSSIANVENVQDVDGEAFTVVQYDDGKFLDEVLKRSTDEGFPFSIDHILLIASKISGALAHCYEKGVPFGFLSPSSIHISFEGDVKLYDTLIAQYMPGVVAQNPQLKPAYADFVHPDVFKTSKSGEAYDVFSIGAIIFKLLTGKPFVEDGVVPDVQQKLKSAVLGSSSFGDDPIPDDIREILGKALTMGGGYRSVQEFNEVLENLIFSGDYSPTTFNLAFFMHSLYREKSEQSAKLLELEKTANYAGYFMTGGDGDGTAKKMSKGLLAGLIGIILVVVVVGGYFFVQQRRAEQHRRLAEQKALQEIAKQKELERKKNEEIAAMKADMDAKIKKIMSEAEKEADQKAKDYLMKQVEEERKKQMEQIRKAEAEKKRIEEETKKKQDLLAQQQMAAEQKKKAALEQKQKEEAAKLKQEEEERQKKIAEEKKKEEEKKSKYGQLVGLSTVDVEPKLIYQEKPKISSTWRVRGTVLLTALVDENGNTTQVKVLRGFPTASKGAKLAEHRIVDTVMKWKYTPALQDGVAVKVWITIRVTI